MEKNNVEKGFVMNGTREEVTFLIHSLSRNQQKDAMAADSRPKKVCVCAVYDDYNLINEVINEL